MSQEESNTETDKELFKELGEDVLLDIQFKKVLQSIVIARMGWSMDTTNGILKPAVPVEATMDIIEGLYKSACGVFELYSNLYSVGVEEDIRKAWITEYVVGLSKETLARNRHGWAVEASVPKDYHNLMSESKEIRESLIDILKEKAKD